MAEIIVIVVIGGAVISPLVALVADIVMTVKANRRRAGEAPARFAAHLRYQRYLDEELAWHMHGMGYTK